MANLPIDSRDAPQIPKFYSSRKIFITGASGFMGKVLIERLLSTCPDIGQIYLLMRRKRSKSPEERLTKLKQCQVFDVVRKKYPWQLEKLCVIAGDVTQPELGLSPGSIQLLSEVSIIFHNAACVKLDDPLRFAVENNLRPTIELLRICDNLPSLEVFVYVSTAYSNAELHRIEEKVYPPPVPLQDLFNLIENTSDSDLEKMTRKYVHPKPNTYTFTKAMAEHVVAEHSKTKTNYSTAIFRPSIVVSSLRHPFPGWIDNYNGPSGFLVAAGKGLLHVCLSDEEKHVSYVPVDIAIDTLIAVAWETAVEKPKPVRVYTCSSGDNPTTLKKFKEFNLKTIRFNYPLGKPLWYPFIYYIKNRYLYKVLETCLQTLPLYAAGTFFRIIGKKMPIDFIEISKMLTKMNEACSFFMTREWDFETHNVKRLIGNLSAADADLFNLDIKTVDWEKFYRDTVIGINRFLLKNSDKSIFADRMHLCMLCVLHYGVMMSLAMFLFRKMRIGRYSYLLTKNLSKKFLIKILGGVGKC